jgi:hypothetical protein
MTWWSSERGGTKEEALWGVVCPLEGKATRKRGDELAEFKLRAG